MNKTLQAFQGPVAAPRGSIIRHAAAVALRIASVALTRLSRKIRIADPGQHVHHEPELEFYAESGAPEGALYINGDLVGYVKGVTRL